jgi:zinc protease
MSPGRKRSGCALSALVARGTGCAALTIIVGITTISTVDAQFPPPARPPKSTSAPAQPVSPASLPSARSIIDRHVVAMGGREAILSHKSMSLKGSLSMPSAGMTGTLEVFGALPNKSLLRVSLGGVGEVVEGFDGTHGWSLSPMTGPMLLEGKQLEERRFDSDFHSELRTEARYASMTTLEQTDFDGRSCYKLLLVRKAGGEETEFYDVQTGLKAGSITTRETQMGVVTSTAVIMEYRKFGNLLQASTVRQQVGPMEQVIKVDSIEYDSVPASVFVPPAGIKALIK